MKKYLSALSLILLLQACQTKTKAVGPENLQAKKEKIVAQIDSLNRLLTQIDKQLMTNESASIPKIDAMVVLPKSFTHYIDLQGNVDTDGNVLVVPEAMGTVKKVFKNEGDFVRKGQTILILDDRVIRNQIDEVKTQYALAKTAYERQQRLWKQKIGSEMAYLQAKTKKEALERKLKTLQAQLDKFHVKAPVSGTLDDLMIKEGEMAAPQRPVARLVNLQKVYVQADVSEKYLPVIKKNTLVQVIFSEINQQRTAKVNYVGNFIHPNNRTFKIRVNLSNSDNLLKPNLTANLKIKDFSVDNAIVLPLSLIQEDRQGQNFVFVLQPVPHEKGVYKVVKRIVHIGKTYKDQALVTDGLHAGDIITTLAGRGLTEGDKVQIQNMEQFVKQLHLLKNNSHFHVVKNGESLKNIAKQYNVSVLQLKKWNRLKDKNIKSGQKIVVKQ